MYKSIAEKFLIHGDVKSTELFGNGHINKTMAVFVEHNGIVSKYILRRINKYVFNHPEIVIANTINVTEFIRSKMVANGEHDVNSRVLMLIETKKGEYYYRDELDDYWCMMPFYDNTFTIDYPQSAEQVFKAAKEFGKFQRYLVNEDINKYGFSIKDFHNTPMRLNNLRKAIISDSYGRVNSSQKEIDRIIKDASIVQKITKLQADKNFPLRITHNDTKLNNVLLDKDTYEGLCVIDLDTVMPGYVIYDFGDMVRTSACEAMEDEKDISRVNMRVDYYEAIVKGYIGELAGVLTPLELDNMVYGAVLIIYEQAIRFITDYLDGDRYYKINYSDHNLVRARNQLALLHSVQTQSDVMNKILNKFRIIK